MAHLMNHDTWSLVFIESVNIMRNSSTLTTLRSVCRAWSHIVGSTIQLWATLVLDRKVHFKNLEYIRFHLQKSGENPLDVYINMMNVLPFNFEDDVPDSQIHTVASILREHVWRLRVLDILLPRGREANANTWICSIGQSLPAPLLERLSLQIDRPSFYIKFTALLTAFTPSPKLIHLEFGGLGLMTTPLFPHFAIVTSLTFDRVRLGPYDETNTMAGILRSTLNLQHFVYEPRNNSDLDLASPPLNYDSESTISLPHLLTADISTHGIGINVLLLLDAPLLEVMQLDGYTERQIGEEGPWKNEASRLRLKAELISTVLTHISRVSRNLRKLELSYARPANDLEDHRHIFSGFPNLEELILVATGVSDYALTAGTGRLLHLKRLELRHCGRVSIVGLGWFIEGRRSDFVLGLHACQGVRKNDIKALSTIIQVKEYDTCFRARSYKPNFKALHLYLDP